MSDRSVHDRLRRELDSAAQTIDVGDAAAGLAAAHASVRRRQRRRTRWAAVFGTVGAVAGVATLVALRGEDDRAMRTADELASEDSGVLVDEDAATDGDASDATPSEPVPGVVPPPAVASPVAVEPMLLPGLGSGDGGPFVEWLVPWDDGFLAAHVDRDPQPSPPPLPDELRDRFPPEVLELFPDGLPPTLDEATSILSEAGLLDEVMEILDSDPELQDAILGGERGAIRLAVSYSVDGVEWSPIEIELPAELQETLDRIERVTAVGDRLVIAGMTSSPADPDVPGEMVVASTTDLVTWAVQVVSVDAPSGLPPSIRVETYANGFAANRLGWVTSFETMIDVDVFSLLPDELGDRADEGYGVGIGPDGIEVELFGEDGESEQILIGWERLELDETQRALVDRYFSGPPTAELWAASWDGIPTSAQGEAMHGNLMTIGDGFLLVSDVARFSADGLVWSEVDTPNGEHVTAVLPLEQGSVVLTQNRTSESHAYLVDDAVEQWVQIEIPDAPPSATPMMEARASPVVVVDGAEPPDWAIEAVVEQSGLRLTIADSRLSRSYELVDIATGGVIATEQVDTLNIVDGTDPFEGFRYDDSGGVTVFDADTGAELLVVAASDLRQAFEEAHEDVDFHHEPDMWLLATIDGETWLVDDLDDADPRGNSEWWPITAAVNGDTVLVVGTSGWLSYKFP